MIVAKGEIFPMFVGGEAGYLANSGATGREMFTNDTSGLHDELCNSLRLCNMLAAFVFGYARIRKDTRVTLDLHAQALKESSVSD